jgi:hypothetical protein
LYAFPPSGADLHGNYAPSEGNRTISTSYLAPSILATAGASQVLARHAR